MPYRRCIGSAEPAEGSAAAPVRSTHRIEKDRPPAPGEVNRWQGAYVMSQIRIDTIAFDVRIAWQSVVFSILLTAVFAAIVNVVMYFKLRRISMAESLKSIE